MDDEDATFLKAPQKKSLHVRAQFDYDPSDEHGLPSRGLSFTCGDILHVTNASDEHWWQARRLGADGTVEAIGIIPSKERVERKLNTRGKNVKFGNYRGKASTLDSSRSKGTVLNAKKRQKKVCAHISLDEVGTKNDSHEQDLCSYEAVVQQKFDCPRPVVLLGATKDLISEKLVAEFPEQFSSCVPHTTRQRRSEEVDGIHYHFVSDRSRMEHEIACNKYLEAGVYNGNLYGTALSSVISQSQTGRHCIVDVGGEVVQRLITVGMHPIAILIKTPSADWLRSMRPNLDEEKALLLIQREKKVEMDWSNIFTEVIEGEEINDIYLQVKNLISEQSSKAIWLPATA